MALSLYETLRSGEGVGSTLPWVREGLAEAVWVKVDNVAQFYYRDSSQGVWDLVDDFPNVAPPWPHAFYEFTVPNMMNYEGKISRRQGFQAARQGALISAIDCDQSESPFTGRGQREMEWNSDRFRWVICCALFVQPDPRLSPMLVSYTIFPVTREGCLAKRTATANHQILSIAACGEEFEERARQTGMTDADIKAALQEMAYSGLHVPMLAVCFCHCKNVVVQRIDPPAALSRKQEKRYGVPKLSYHVVEIQPMRAVLEREGGLSRNGAQQALHICRGHFKDYRERGLFGRHKGIYWWDMQTRGNAKAGIAAKDYAVHAP